MIEIFFTRVYQMVVRVLYKVNDHTIAVVRSG